MSLYGCYMWIRKRLELAIGLEVRHRIDQRISSEWLGGKEHGWRVHLDGLTAESIVYSLGVGSDISFDLEMIHRCGSHIYAFDPTPDAIAFLEGQTLPKQYHFIPEGVSDEDGTMEFRLAPPLLPIGGERNFTLADSPSAEKFTAPAIRLSTAMQRLGHDHIDLLKMDIEGGEYRVLRDAISSSLNIRQIVVEFHHRKRYIDKSETNDIVHLLRQAGFSLYYISDRWWEYGFIRMD